MKQPHYIELYLPVKTWWVFTRKRRIKFTFNLWSFFQLYEKRGIDLGDLDKQNQDDLASEMIYNAAIAGYLSDIDIPFTRQDTDLWMRWLGYKDPDSLKTHVGTLTKAMQGVGEVVAKLETAQEGEKKK